ncbi:MAG: hypothetical protein ABI720_12860, partial [Actinomycetes bacterium]
MPGDNPMTPKVERRFEIVSAIILSLAALATAFAGYQASLWDGVQSSDYGKASALRVTSAEKATAANEYRLADLGVFEGYVNARLSGDQELASFYRTRFRSELEVAFDAWVALDPWNSSEAPPSPLAMPEYQLPLDQEADDLVAQAEALFASGEDANSVSDVFTLGTLLFAASLFFAAISERFEVVGPRTTLVAISAIALLSGVA